MSAASSIKIVCFLLALLHRFCIMPLIIDTAKQSSTIIPGCFPSRGKRVAINGRLTDAYEWIMFCFSLRLRTADANYRFHESRWHNEYCWIKPFQREFQKLRVHIVPLVRKYLWWGGIYSRVILFIDSRYFSNIDGLGPSFPVNGRRTFYVIDSFYRH